MIKLSQAQQFLVDNYETIQAAYKSHFGDIMNFANPRVEAVLSDNRLLISCHYDGYDDYNEDCGNPDCLGGCEICDNKDSWDFELYIDGLLPGGVMVA